MRSIFLVLTIFASSINSNLLFNKISFKNLMKHDNKCFDIKYKVYQSRFFLSKEFSLVNFLNELVVKNCSSSVELECKMKNFAFSSDTKLIYQYFCENIDLKNHCLPTLSGLLGLNKAELKNSNWSIISQKSFAIVNKKSNKSFFSDSCVAFVLLANLNKVKDLEIRESKSFSTCETWTIEFNKNKKKLFSTSNLNKLVKFMI